MTCASLAIQTPVAEQSGFISASAKPAAENLHPFGFLNIAGELIFVFARVGHPFGFLRSIVIERLDAGADKMRAVARKRSLNLGAKRRGIFDGAGALDAAAFGHGF